MAELSRKSPDAALLMITGSPALHAFRDLPANADVLKIPTIVKTGTEDSQPPHLPIGVEAVTALRRDLILQALATFRPDVFLVDNFPLGSRKELLPALRALRAAGCRTIVGLRDIVDMPETVRAHWRRDGVYEALASYFDRILVYGTPEILDIVEAYDLPPEVGCKVHYCGYVAPTMARRPKPCEVRAEMGLPAPYVLATVGGGGDGLPLISDFLRAMHLLPDLAALVVTGPLMGAGERAKVEVLASQNGRVVLRDYLQDLPRYMAAAEAVVAMGGYNTVAEIVVQQCPAVVVPRTWRYGEHASRGTVVAEGEQLVRAQALARLGQAEFIHPDALTPQGLAEKISAALGRPKAEGAASIDTGGAARAADHVLALAASGG